MANTLALFWGLTAPERDARLSASDALVETLVSQKPDAPDVPPAEPGTNVAAPTDAEAAATEQRLDEYNASEVSYAVRRLVRGLGSPREHARMSFAITLSELLTHLSQHTTAHDVLVLLLKYTVTRGSMSGQETRDLQFARLFGIFALIRSRLLYADHLTTFMRAFDVLVAVAAQRSWLSESCGYVLTQMLEPLARDDALRPTWADEALARVAERVSAAQLTPESLALLLVLARLAPGVCKVPQLKEPLFAAGNLPLLARMLREAAPLHLGPGPAPSPGTWNTTLPFVWDLVLDVYFAPETAPNLQGAPFADVFRVLVDESLFANAASPERKSWGFQVLHRALERAPADVLPFLFTPNLMRTWVNQLASKDRLLHAMAHKTVTYVAAAVKRNPTAGVALVTQLMGEHGRPDFDRVTHTKTIESILSSLDESGIQRYLAYLRGVAYDAHNTQGVQWACDQMLSLVRSNLVPKSDAWMHDVLAFFGAHGYFTVHKAPALCADVVRPAPFSDAVRDVCRQRFQACLAELRDDAAGQSWTVNAAAMLDVLERDAGCVPLLSSAARVRVDAVRKLLRRLDKLVKKARDHTQRHARAFATLVAAVSIVTREDADDATDLVEPLVDASRLLFEDAQADISGMEMLTDALIGLLELSSAFLRSVVSRVFAEFSGEMTAASLDHLIGQLGLSDEAEAEGVDEDEEGEDEDEDEDEDGDEDEDEDAEADPILRARVEEAFRTIGHDDDDDTPFDDDQMEQLDDQLAAIFQQHSSSRRKEREALQRDTALFHNKILDLLEIYAKEQSANVLAVRLVAPLFALARGSGDVSPQVATRASHILRSRLCRAKEVPHGALDVAQIVDELGATHAFVRATQDPPMADLANAVSLYYTKVLLRNGHTDEPAAVYGETLRDFLRRKASPVRPAFLLEGVRRFPELGWALRAALLDGARLSYAVHAFRQMQALTMLQAVLQQQQHADSRQASVSDALAFVHSVRDVVFTTVRGAVDGEDASLNAQRLKDVLRFALQAVRITSRIAENDAALVQAAWPVTEIEQLGTYLQDSERFRSSTSLHGMIKEMCAVVRRAGEKRAVSAPKRARSDAESVAGGASSTALHAAGSASAATSTDVSDAPRAKRQATTAHGASR